MGRESRDEGEVMTQLREETPDGRVFEVVAIGQAQPDQGVVETLEAMLERAKAGEVRGVVIMARLRDESHDHAMAGQREVIPLIGQLHRLIHRVQIDADQAMNPGLPISGG